MELVSENAEGATVSITVRLTSEQSTALDAVAEQTGQTRSDLVRLGVDLLTDPIVLGAHVAVALLDVAQADAQPDDSIRHPLFGELVLGGPLPGGAL